MDTNIKIYIHSTYWNYSWEHFEFIFLTLTIFNNGTFVIEIIEDLESINFGSDLYSTFSCVKDKIYPLINQEKIIDKDSINCMVIDIVKILEMFLDKLIEL